jgi:hypothetical protein
MSARPFIPISESVSQSFKELAASTAQLNTASDELTRSIGPIDTALKMLGVRVTVWHQYAGTQDSSGHYWRRRIGYALIRGTWGLALSTVSGSQPHAEDHYEEWLYNDAPHAMRVEALDHVPALFETLAKQVTKAATELKKKTDLARQLAATITVAAEELTK